MATSLHWCPNGCGKKIVSNGYIRDRYKRYVCKKCNTNFTKEELEEYWK
jgi:transposase-like protein